MTLIYELDPYSLMMCQMSRNELPMSRLSKVIVLQTPTELYAMPLCGWSTSLVVPVDLGLDLGMCMCKANSVFHRSGVCK